MEGAIIQRTTEVATTNRVWWWWKLTAGDAASFSFWDQKVVIFFPTFPMRSIWVHLCFLDVTGESLLSTGKKKPNIPGDSSRDLFIPDRWRTLNLWICHVFAIPKMVTKNCQVHFNISLISCCRHSHQTCATPSEPTNEGMHWSPRPSRAWRIIPLVKWLVTPIYKPFRPFITRPTLLRRLTTHGTLEIIPSVDIQANTSWGERCLSGMFLGFK